MTLHKAIIRITLFIAISLVGSSGWCYTLASPIELSQLISLFMTNPNEYPSWSMGVGETGRQIKWTSIGVEEHKHCGSYASCRKGVARVSIGKKEMQNLRERLDPVEWNIFIASSSLSKFGPKLIEIAPLCDTVQCSFELNKP